MRFGWGNVGGHHGTGDRATLAGRSGTPPPYGGVLQETKPGACRAMETRFGRGVPRPYEWGYARAKPTKTRAKRRSLIRNNSGSGCAFLNGMKKRRADRSVIYAPLFAGPAAGIPAPRRSGYVRCPQCPRWKRTAPWKGSAPEPATRRARPASARSAAHRCCTGT